METSANSTKPSNATNKSHSSICEPGNIHRAGQTRLNMTSCVSKPQLGRATYPTARLPPPRPILRRGYPPRLPSKPRRCCQSTKPKVFATTSAKPSPSRPKNEPPTSPRNGRDTRRRLPYRSLSHPVGEGARRTGEGRRMLHGPDARLNLEVEVFHATTVQSAKGIVSLAP